MKKLLFTILALLIFPQVSFGATYEQTINSTYVNVTRSVGNTYYIEKEFYTSPSATTTISSVKLNFSYNKVAYEPNIQLCAYVGGVCTNTLGTTLFSPTGTRALDFYTQSGLSIQVPPNTRVGIHISWLSTLGDSFVTYGNTSEIPYYQIIDGGTPTSITLSSPIAQTYTNNPVTWVANYSLVDGCYDSIVYQTEYLNASSTPTFTLNQSPTQFNQCVTAQTGVATSTVNLPFEGNWRTRAMIVATSTASSTAWTAWTYFGLGNTSYATTTAGSFVPEDCNMLDVGCGFRNALGWAFIPTVDFWGQIDQYRQSAGTRAPFIYLQQMASSTNALLNTNATSTFAITLNNLHFTPGATTSLTLLSSAQIEAVPFSSTIRTILGYLVWFFVARGFYRRVMRIFDDHTEV